jgi:hypothetical protein
MCGNARPTFLHPNPTESVEETRFTDIRHTYDKHLHPFRHGFVVPPSHICIMVVGGELMSGHMDNLGHGIIEVSSLR